MVRKGKKKVNDITAWQPPSKEGILAGLKAFQDEITASTHRRRELNTLAVTRNNELGAMLGEEFAKAGIDIKKIMAAGLDYAIQEEEEAKKYWQEKKPTSGPKFSPYTFKGGSEGSLRTPPYDFTWGWVDKNPQSLLDAWYETNQSGFMRYHMSSLRNETSSADVNALVGIWIPPDLPTFPPDINFGMAFVQATAGYRLTGRIDSRFAPVHADGFIGWLVQAFDANTGNYVQNIESTWTEIYRIEKGVGDYGTAIADKNNESYHMATLFNTQKEYFYVVYVWLGGSIEASMGSLLWPWSHAAAYGQINVGSINWIALP